MEIGEERTMFHLTEMVHERISGVLEWRRIGPLITKPKVCGREEDKDRILEFLVGDAFDFEDLSIYPIIGLSRLGKTTLVQFIFNQE